MPKKITQRIQDKVESNVDYTKMDPEINGVNIERNESINTLFDDAKYEPELEVIVDDDGNIEIFSGEEGMQEGENPDFYENLAAVLDEDVLDDIGSELNDKYESDKSAREPRDEMYKKALERAGLTDKAHTRGADFEGSSEVTHPMLTKSSVDFAARASRELCPPNGPVKSEVFGTATPKKLNDAQRKVDFFNYLFIHLMPYMNAFQQMLSQLPMTGTQFMKFWYDDYLKRPNCEFLPMDHVFIPDNCNNFYNAERVTVVTNLSAMDYWRRCKDGLYYDPEYFEDLDDNDDIDKLLPQGSGMFGNSSFYRSKTDRLNDKIEGKKEANDTEEYVLLEVYAYLNLKDDYTTKGEYAPYIITVKTDTQEVIGLYRNWDIEDEKRQKLDYITKFDFIPWRGAYGIGLAELIGSLSGAATGALRGLLDSAHTNNIPTAFALKGLKMAGQSPDMAIGKINMVEGPSGMIDDIRKVIMELPFNPPSPVLYQLLEFMTSQADQVVKMPDGLIDGMGNRTPANTTLAMIEQGSTTQSAIHARLHFAQMKNFEIIGRLVRDHFHKDGYPEWLLEDLKINAGLFDHTRDIVPVSDPNIFSEVQRYAQLEAVMNMAQADPQSFNKNELYKRALQLIKIPQPQMILNIPSEVKKLNAVAENAALMMNQSIVVYPDQNHLDHICVHLAFLRDPVFGQTEAFNSNNVQMIEHLKEHLMYIYAQTYQQAIKNESSLQNYSLLTDETSAFDSMLKQVTPDVLQHIAEGLVPYIKEATPIIASLMQLQQKQQSQNQNPEQIKVQIEQAKLQQAQTAAQNEGQKVQADQQAAQAKIQLEQAKLDQQGKVEQMRMQIEQVRAQSEVEIAQLQLKIEQEESEASIYIEELRAANDRKQALEQLQLEVMKHEKEMSLESFKSGHSDGLEAIKHKEELKLKQLLEQKKIDKMSAQQPKTQ